MKNLPLILLALSIYLIAPIPGSAHSFFQHKEKRLAAAQQQFDIGDYLSADATLQHLWASNSDPELAAKILYLWGESDFLAGLYLDATDHYRHYLKIKPIGDQADAVYCRLGWIAEQQHDFTTARFDYDRAIALASTDNARTGKLRVLLAEGRFDDAKTLLNTLPDKLATPYRPLLDARGALGFDPTATTAHHYQLAKNALQANDTRTVLQEFLNATELELQPELRDDARLQAGKLLIAEHDDSRATKILSPTPETNTCTAEWLYWKGIALQSQKRITAAATVFTTLLEQYPQSPHIVDGYLRLSTIHCLQGNIRQALQDRATAIDHGANSLALLPETIRLHIVLGDTTTARGLWNTLPDSSRFDRAFLDGLLKWGTPASNAAFQQATRLVGQRHTSLLAFSTGAQALQRTNVLSQKAGLQEAVHIAALANDSNAVFFLGAEYARHFPYVTRLTQPEMEMEILIAGFEIQASRYDGAIHRYERIISCYPDEDHRKIISLSIRNLFDIVPEFSLPDSLRAYRPHGTGFEQALRTARDTAANGHWKDALALLQKLPPAFPGVTILTLQGQANSGANEFPRFLSSQLNALTGHELESAALSGLDYALTTHTRPTKECLQVLDSSDDPAVRAAYQLHLVLLAEQQGDLPAARTAINRAYLASATPSPAFQSALSRVYRANHRKIPTLGPNE